MYPKLFMICSCFSYFKIKKLICTLTGYTVYKIHFGTCELYINRKIIYICHIIKLISKILATKAKIAQNYPNKNVLKISIFI